MKLDADFRPDRKNPVYVEVKTYNDEWEKRILLFVNKDGSCLCVVAGSDGRYLSGDNFTTYLWNKDGWRPLPKPSPLDKWIKTDWVESKSNPNKKLMITGIDYQSEFLFVNGTCWNIKNIEEYYTPCKSPIGTNCTE